MGKNAQAVRVGPSNIKYGGIDIGFTEGEITATYTAEYREFRPDQNTGIVKQFLINEGFTVTIPLAQINARDLMNARAFAAGALRATPEGGGGDTTLTAAIAAGTTVLPVVDEANFDVGNFVIISGGLKGAEIREVLSAAAGTVTLVNGTQFAHLNGATVKEIAGLGAQSRVGVGNNFGEPVSAVLDIEPLDGGEKIRLYKAVVVSDVEAVLQKAEETIVEVTFTALADITRVVGDQIFTWGDLTVT